MQRNVDSEKIAITPADKGGSILIVDPQMLRKKTLEKLEDPNVYRKLETDPLPELRDKLFNLWVYGKEQCFISPEEAKLVMGISNNRKEDSTEPTNRPSTAPRFKPGKSYFYPSLKVHKLKKDELVPGVEPPVRLISALHDGISKRSDVYIAAKFLRDLEKDYCADLLTDNTDALQWLDNIDKEFPAPEKMQFKSYTYDFKALYDSLNPDLVVEALQHAMNTCRSPWSPELMTWIIDLVKLSLKSSIGTFQDTWYEQINGVPTGGSLCVQLANMTVFYILNKYVYSDSVLMKDVATTKRYIDDGAGHFKGTIRQFHAWIKRVNDIISPFGLNIDEFQIENTGTYVNFLDIKFMFDEQGDLQTDLYIKETDSRSYLHFTSSHPNHVFSGTVFSQCLRLRRIINSTDRLKVQLEELKSAFLESGYPKTMIDNIAAKALRTERILERKVKPIKEPLTSVPPSPMLVVSSYGSDDSLMSVVRKYEPHLQRTRSFSESDCSSPSSLAHSPTTPASQSGQFLTPHSSTSQFTSRQHHRRYSESDCVPSTSPTTPQARSTSPLPPDSKPLFKYVKKSGLNLRSRLLTSKVLAMGQKHGKTTPCNRPRCDCCSLISDVDVIKVNGKRVRSAPGSCKTYNIVYLVRCSVCSKVYVGRTISPLHVRMNGHRSKYYEVIEGRVNCFDITNDEHSLGIHLVDHGYCNRSDFNDIYNVCIIENCSPGRLDVKENKYIHLLNSLRPHGLNTVNPFGLRLIN